MFGFTEIEEIFDSLGFPTKSAINNSIPSEILYSSKVNYGLYANDCIFLSDKLEEPRID